MDSFQADLLWRSFAEGMGFGSQLGVGGTWTYDIPYAGETFHNGMLFILPQVMCFQSSRKAMPCLLQKG